MRALRPAGGAIPPESAERHLRRPSGAPASSLRIPRAFARHDTAEGYRYRTYLVAIMKRLGPLPADATPTLREVGRLAVELEAMGRELEAARGRNRRRDVSRLRRLMIPMRTQLLTLEHRLEELAVASRKAVPPMVALALAPVKR